MVGKTKNSSQGYDQKTYETIFFVIIFFGQ